MTEPGMMNIYYTKIKLRAAAHQAIYLVIFHLVTLSKHLCMLIWKCVKYCKTLIYPLDLFILMF